MTDPIPVTPDLQPSKSERARSRLAELRERRDAIRVELRDLLETKGAAGVQLARQHAERADGLLRDLYDEVIGDSGPPLLLGAVGGYGRRLLGFESDLDICFVTEQPPEQVAARVEAILYPLWDARISVGHQIVQVSDAADDAQNELTMATELLDFRPLSGDLRLFDLLRDRLWKTVFSERMLQRFLDKLEAQAAVRHKQYGDSVYLLEPDVKNGTGGLRDLDFALWAARARFGTGDLPALAEMGVLGEPQHDATHAALDFLWTIRNHLHRAAGRKNDRLTFGQQEVVARALGYERAYARPVPDLQRNGEMVEAFMSEYYRHARVIAQARDQILGRARRRLRSAQPEPVPLEGGLVECGGRVGLAAPSRLRDEPTMALRVYRAAVDGDMQLLSRTRDAIAEATSEPDFCARLRGSTEAAELFVSLLCTIKEVSLFKGSILSELHDVGLLLAMIPEFSPVVGRVHHDLYHVYTVDIHSIAAVDRLRALSRGELASKHPLPCRLAAELTRPRVVFMATLLHDVGKDIGGAKHAERGAEMARGICARLGLPEEEIDDICHLILHHLTMYVVAVRRDLGDPETVSDFANVARGREGLRELYLLTVADLSTTSAVAMTTWKAGMLGALFRGTDAFLAGRPHGADRVARVQGQVRALWPYPDRADGLEQFLSSMPDRYFLANSPAEIAAHAKLATEPNAERVSCALVPTAHEGTLELCVVTDARASVGLYVAAGDRPGLLAAIAAAISVNGLTIQAAQINSRALPQGTHQALDLFWVRNTGAEGDFSAKVGQLQRDITAIIDGTLTPATLMKPPKKPSWSVRNDPPVATEVIFDHHGSAHHTIIEVLTGDRFGLLYLLARVIHGLGLSISVAKVTTEGKRAIDVFYVSEADGSKVERGPRAEQVREALLEALEGAPAAMTA